jgi:hypothetical protein
MLRITWQLEGLKDIFHDKLSFTDLRKERSAPAPYDYDGSTLRVKLSNRVFQKTVVTAMNCMCSRSRFDPD